MHRFTEIKGIMDYFDSFVEIIEVKWASGVLLRFKDQKTVQFIDIHSWEVNNTKKYRVSFILQLIQRIRSYAPARPQVLKFEVTSGRYKGTVGSLRFSSDPRSTYQEYVIKANNKIICGPFPAHGWHSIPNDAIPNLSYVDTSTKIQLKYEVKKRPKDHLGAAIEDGDIILIDKQPFVVMGWDDFNGRFKLKSTFKCSRDPRDCKVVVNLSKLDVKKFRNQMLLQRLK